MTTDVTDGFKTSLNINRVEQEEVPVDEFAGKDGTIPQEETTRPKQSMLEKFFDKANTFTRRTKSRGPVVQEDIESSSEQSGGGDGYNDLVFGKKSDAVMPTNWDEEVKKAAQGSEDPDVDERRLSSEFRSQQSRQDAVNPRSSSARSEGSAGSVGFRFVKTKADTSTNEMVLNSKASTAG